jgi:hypothetical protein
MLCMTVLCMTVLCMTVREGGTATGRCLVGDGALEILAGRDVSTLARQDG